MRGWRSQRRGAQQGVQKHRIFISKLRLIGQENISSVVIAPFISQEVEDKLLTLANWTFNLFAKLNCSTLSLLPYEFLPEQDLLRPMSSWRKKLLYYFMVSLCMLQFAHKISATIYSAMTMGAHMTTFICMGCCLPSFLGFLSSRACHSCREETLLVVNEWRCKISDCWPSSQEDDDDEWRKHSSRRIGDVKVSLIVIAAAGGALLAPWAIVGATVLIEIWPLFYYDIVKASGIVHLESFFSPLVGRLLLAPLEYFWYLIPTLMAVWPYMILLVTVSSSGSCLDQLRNHRVTGMAGHAYLRQKYLRLRVYHAAETVYIRSELVPTIFGGSCAIIMCFFLSIRSSDIGLPPWLTFVDMYCGVLSMIAVFWLCWDIVVVMRASEDVVETLASRTAPFFCRLSKQERMHVVKLGKGIRPLIYHFGSFMEMSLDVSVSTFDEIINQLLFLLELY